MISVDCARTASSNASPRHTDIASPPPACAPQCSAPGSITGPSDPVWPSSPPNPHIRNTLSPRQSAPLKPPSIAGTTVQNLQPKNLTQPCHKFVFQDL